MFAISSSKNKVNLPFNIFIPYFVALLVFYRMDMSSKLSRNSFETCDKTGSGRHFVGQFSTGRIKVGR